MKNEWFVLVDHLVDQLISCSYLQRPPRYQYRALPATGVPAVADVRNKYEHLCNLSILICVIVNSFIDKLWGIMCPNVKLYRGRSAGVAFQAMSP